MHFSIKTTLVPMDNQDIRKKHTIQYPPHQSFTPFRYPGLDVPIHPSVIPDLIRDPVKRGFISGPRIECGVTENSAG